MDKLHNSTREAFAAFACRRNEATRIFLRMLVVISVKPTVTDKLFTVNSGLKLISSEIEDQRSGEKRSSK